MKSTTKRLSIAKAERAAKLLARIMSGMQCEELYHRYAHRHELGEECPALAEAQDAAFRLQEFVTSLRAKRKTGGPL